MAGVLAEIRMPEGTTVQVNTVVAVVAESETAEASREPARSAKSAESAADPNTPAPKEAPQSQSDAPRVPPKVRSDAPHGPQGVDVVMPQMGESIFEGTITKWLKKAGDPVQKDEPLFEISTDKVDAEIPALVSGVLTEIKVPEGSTVEINTVVAVIGGAPAVAQPDGSPTQQAPARMRAEAARLPPA